MMRSLYAGVSGLKNHQTRMDVIGNNISNVNTVGYKSSRVVFKDLYSQTLAGASAASASVGGTNPKQIGLGVSLGAIDVMHTPSASQYTGASLDCMIEGDGFFIVRRGIEQLYTRAGNFGLDEAGNLCVGTEGQYVMGYMINPDNGEYIMTVPGEKSETTLGPITLTETVANALNNDKTLTVKATETSTGSGVVRLFLNYQGTNSKEVLIDTAKLTGADAVDFTTTVSVAGMEFDMVIPATTTAATLLALHTDDIANPDPAKVGTIGSGARGVDPDPTQGPLANIMIGDNYYDIAIDEKGMISGIDRNTGDKINIAQLAVGTFYNNPGLEKVGSNMYRISNNSGDVTVNFPGSGLAGKLNVGSLEMSNVDLADAFTDMIVTQRGFQANSRTITTSDQMLEEIVNLKR